MTGTVTARIAHCESDDCDASIVQKRTGRPRRFCDTCRTERRRAWKRANPDKVAKQQRDRRKRRSYDHPIRRTA